MAGRDEDLPTVCLLGSPGTGKSSTCNSLLGCRSNDSFSVSHGTGASTGGAEAKVRPWRGRGALVRCVDLPSIGSPDGLAGCRAADLVADLRGKVSRVHAFLIILNGQAPRFDGHLKDMLVALRHALGNEFLENVMIGFTRWAFTRSARRRREQKGQTESWKAELANRELRKLLGHDFDCPCVFIDNALNASGDEELVEEFGAHLPEVMREFESELEKIYAFACDREPFDCGALRPPPTVPPLPSPLSLELTDEGPARAAGGAPGEGGRQAPASRRLWDPGIGEAADSARGENSRTARRGFSCDHVWMPEGTAWAVDWYWQLPPL